MKLGPPTPGSKIELALICLVIALATAAFVLAVRW